MMLPVFILVASAMTAVPISAEVAAADHERAHACFEAHDWSCVLDQFSTKYEGPNSRTDCLAAGREACWIDMMMVMVSGVGAAENAGPLERRVFAERALNILKPMSEQEFEEEGELLLSAIRYDACSTAKDEACMAESADLIRRAVAHGPDIRAAAADLYDMFDKVGVRYPIDLEGVVNEVARMEPQE
jgi:hypothetical protein